MTCYIYWSPRGSIHTYTHTYLIHSQVINLSCFSPTILMACILLYSGYANGIWFANFMYLLLHTCCRSLPDLGEASGCYIAARSAHNMCKYMCNHGCPRINQNDRPALAPNSHQHIYIFIRMVRVRHCILLKTRTRPTTRHIPFRCDTARSPLCWWADGGGGRKRWL